MKFFIEGFIAKILTGADDTLVHIPLVTSLTKKRMGRLFFISGMFTSVVLLSFLSLEIAVLTQNIPYKNIIASLMLLTVAGLVVWNKLEEREKQAEKRIGKKVKKKNLFGLFFTGMLAFLITGIDDVLVYSAILIKPFSQRVLILAGIWTAAIVELIIVFYFSKQISKVKHAHIISAIGLVILAVIVGFNGA